MSGAEYVELARCEITRAVDVREETGLDVTVRGELKRNDMVRYPGENQLGSSPATALYFRPAMTVSMTASARCSASTVSTAFLFFAHGVVAGCGSVQVIAGSRPSGC